MKHFLFASVDAAADASVGAVPPETGSMLYLDIGVFVAFILFVLFVAIFMGRSGKKKEGQESESYFLAGRGLGWCLIGFSLIAANISTEQFVGMSGQAAKYLGLAIASFEWMAAVTLVFVAFLFLPQFLKTGIYTIPEFLEKRYNRFSRTLMSLFMAIMLISVSFAAVVYSGARVFVTLFKDMNIASVPLDLKVLCFVIGFLAMIYVICGGLKACAWADLIQGSALIIGGGMILYFALMYLEKAEPTSLVTTAGVVTQEYANENDLANKNGWERFLVLNKDKLRMNLPATDPIVPFTALFLGMWIPNFYYWGLNQYIVQRTLGAQSLSQGQKGIMFAAVMKLAIPFIVVFPGMIAFNIFHSEFAEEAKDPERNGKAMAAFEQWQPKSAESRVIIDFNDEYAEMNPETANEIVAYNAIVAKMTLPEEGKAIDHQTAIMKKVKAENVVLNRNAWKTWFSSKLGVKIDLDNTVEAAEPTEDSPANEPTAEVATGSEPPAEVPAETAETEQVVAAELAAASEKPYEIFEKQLVGYDYDSAFPLLVSKLIPEGFRGFVLAAILGAVISSLAAVLNAASTIITFDIYREYFARKSSEKSLVFVGRVIIVIFAVCGCCIAMYLDNPKFSGIFTYIQEFQGFLSPGILAAFLFGFFARFAPTCCGPTALLASPIIYGLLMKFTPHIAYLNRMSITFLSVIAILGFLTAFFPRKEPFVPSSDTKIDLRSSRSAKVFGVLVVLITIGLYAYFWEYDWPAFGRFFEDIFFRLLP